MGKRINFVCQWGRNRKTAWSGTYLSILNGLQSYYQVEEICIKTPFISQVYQFLEKRIKVLRHQYQYKDIQKASSEITSLLNSKEECVFTFCEIPFDKKVHSYIYQDMCVDYIQNVILTTSELRNHYSYQRISQKALEKRKANQEKFYRECRGIFTMGKWLADYMGEEMGIPKEKIHVVGAGIDIDVNKIAPIEKENNKILFIGKAFFEAKGGYILIEAFKVLKAKYIHDAELYIVGPKSNPIKGQIEGIHFEGLKSVDELYEYYNKCDIFVMPSYIDAYGKVFAEALCCGMPCIARRAFAMQDIIQDGVNGYLIDNDDINILAKKMYDLLTNQNIKKNVFEHMKEYQKLYSWDSVAERMAAVIDQDEYMGR